MKKSFIGPSIFGAGVMLAVISWMIRISEDRRIYIESLGCVAFWSDDCDSLGQFYPLANILLGLGVLVSIAGVVLFFVLRKPSSPAKKVASEGSVTEISASSFCTGCGKPLAAGSAFCGACGKAAS